MSCRKVDTLSTLGYRVNLADFKESTAKEIPELKFEPTGIPIDLDDVIETAANATGISIDEAELYEGEVSPLALLGDVLPPANDSYYDDRKDKSLPRELHAYQNFKEVNFAKWMKKQQTINYLRPIDREAYYIGDEETPVVSTPEVVLEIGVYKENKQLKTQAYLVYGSQTLTEFIDAIDCAHDLAVCWEENSSNPMLEDVDWSRTTRTSSALFIDDAFYIDTRHSDHVDYSAQIIDFVQRNDDNMMRGVKVTSETKSMSDVRFIELTVNIGMPYLFIHQGSCEHLIIIEQVRFFHPEDDPRRSSYPVQVFRSGPRRQACTICLDQFARWITYHDEEAPSSPCYFCFECFYYLHYSDDNEKLHDFNAYVYLEYGEDRLGYKVAFEKFKAGLVNKKPQVLSYDRAMKGRTRVSTDYRKNKKKNKAESQ